VSVRARHFRRHDLVDEQDTRRVFLGLVEHVADAGGTHTDEHFHEVGARNCEERHARLPCDGAGQQGFTRTGRAHEQSAFGDLAAKAGEFLRVAQELDDFFKLFLGLVDACDVIKGHPAMLFGQQFGAGFAEAHRPAFAATLHPVHEENPDTDDDNEGQQRADIGQKTVLFLRLSTDLNIIVEQHFGDIHLGGFDHDELFSAGLADDPLAIESDLSDLATLDPVDKLRIRNFLRIHLGLTPAEEVEKRHDQQKQNEPEGDVTRVAQGRGNDSFFNAIKGLKETVLWIVSM